MHLALPAEGGCSAAVAVGWPYHRHAHTAHHPGCAQTFGQPVARPDQTRNQRFNSNLLQLKRCCRALKIAAWHTSSDHSTNGGSLQLKMPLHHRLTKSVMECMLSPTRAIANMPPWHICDGTIEMNITSEHAHLVQLACCSCIPTRGG